MKKILTALTIMTASLAASAQTQYSILRACHPDDVKHYDTEQLRSHFMMPTVMEVNKINLTYSLYDRIVYGGVVPVGKTIALETIDPLKAKYFLERRELGIINTGGDGIVTVDGTDYELSFKDALYVGRGKQNVTFRSKDDANPARFYLNSTPAHASYKTQLITIDGRKGTIKANRIKAGSMEESNDRIINQLIVANVLEEGPCQLQMGLTELMPAVYGTPCRLTSTTAVSRYTTTSTFPKAMPSVTLWASRRKTASSGFTTSRRSWPPNGASMLPQERPTTCSSGAWAAKTWTTVTWTRLHILK